MARAQSTSRRSVPDEGADRQTVRTVAIAIAANAVVFVGKAGAGLAGGSAAMLAEAAHSLADTGNQVMLMVSLFRGRREPTPEHPFGHGQERYFWTLLAAVGMFFAGTIFAVGYGVVSLLSGEEASGFVAAFVVLGLSLVAEGSSLLRAKRQTQADAAAAGRSLRRHVRVGRDPNVKMVLLEDTAAVAGILIAAAGLALSALTGSGAFDGAASILIGVLLMVVAVLIARDARSLLVGASATPGERRAIEDAIEGANGITEVQELLTLVLGPSALLVAARIALDDELSADEVEHLSDAISKRVREAVPDVAEVFLDATPG